MPANSLVQRRQLYTFVLLLLAIQLCRHITFASVSLEQALALENATDAPSPTSEETEVPRTPAPTDFPSTWPPTPAPTEPTPIGTSYPTSISSALTPPPSGATSESEGSLAAPTAEPTANPTEKPLTMYGPILVPATQPITTQPATSLPVDSFDVQEALGIPKPKSDEKVEKPSFFRSSGGEESTNSGGNDPEVGCSNSEEVGCGSAAFTRQHKPRGSYASDSSGSSSSSSHSGSFGDGDTVQFPKSLATREQQQSVVLLIVALSVATSFVFGG